MQITTPTGTYKWIKPKWGNQNIEGYNLHCDSDKNIWFSVYLDSILTYHTPEQLVKLGYMELVEENKDCIVHEINPFTKPCMKCGKLTREAKVEETKPTYWYIETSEMKKSEYWEIFKEWFKDKSGEKEFWSFECSSYGYTGYMSYRGFDYNCDKGDNLSPQQWYDTIYDGEKKEEYQPMYGDSLAEMVQQKNNKNDDNEKVWISKNNFYKIMRKLNREDRYFREIEDPRGFGKILQISVSDDIKGVSITTKTGVTNVRLK